MRRIPIMDMFGTPRRLGIVEPVNGQQPATVQVPSPASNPATAFRFEILDAEGNPVPGAAVSIYLNDTHLLTLPLSDVGGNAGVSVADVQSAEYKLRQARRAGRPVPAGMGQVAPQKLYAVIQAPGYVDQKIEIADVMEGTTWKDLKQRQIVTLEKAGETSPLLPILGVAAVVGATIWLVNRS